MPVPFISLEPQHRGIRRQVLKAITEIADSQKFILGRHGVEIEREITRFIGVGHAVGVGSGSDALFLSLTAMGIGAGDEVITTPFTFFASAGAISRTGAKVVFCDIDPDSYNLDVRKIESRITQRTKAILPVHLFGLPCDMEAILKIAKRRQLFVVEDAAQSFGSTFRGKETGSFGDAGCFSFYPTKNLGGAGDGGMVVTRSAALADKIRLLRNHGSRQKYHHEIVGMNSRLDEIQAAWISIKLKHVRRWNAERRKHALVYDSAFKGLPLRIPVIQEHCVPNYHLYSIQCDKRDQLAKHLDRLRIGNGVYYPGALHLQPCYRSLGYKKGDFPVTERVTKRILSLPMYAEMTAAQRNAVIHGVRSFFK